jgi:glycosyltransferase involved in cell wall biosynthesis
MTDSGEGTAPERNSVDASVLVPVLDEGDHIRETVAAMQAQEFDGTLEFLFADGGSSDDTRSILEELAVADPRLPVFDNPRRTTPSGLNVCLRHARGEYVARMDAHTVYPARYVADGVSRLQAGDTRWVSGPPIAAPTGPVSRAVALALDSFLGQGGSRRWAPREEGAGEPEENDLDSGVFAGVWKRDTVLEYGGWDEGWSSNQDAEMAGRFFREGERLVALRSMGAHYVPRNSLRRLWRQYHDYGYYRVRTFRRHPMTMRRSHVFTPGLVLALPAAVAAPRPIRAAARAGLLAYVVAVLVETARGVTRSESPGDALRMPGVFAAMHFGNGVGVLNGIRDFGLPLAALARIAGLTGLAARLDPGPATIDAPSLHGD